MPSKDDTRLQQAALDWIRNFRITGPYVKFENSLSGGCLVDIQPGPETPQRKNGGGTLAASITSPLEPGGPYLATLNTGTISGNLSGGNFTLPGNGISSGNQTIIVVNVPEAGKQSNWCGNGTNLVVWPTGGSGNYTSGNSTLSAPVYWADQSNPYALFAVALTQTGGIAGNSTTTCSYTYTAKDLNGNTLGMSLAPNYSPARIVQCACNAATKGDGYYNASGNFALNGAYETATQTDCI